MEEEEQNNEKQWKRKKSLKTVGHEIHTNQIIS